LDCSPDSDWTREPRHRVVEPALATKSWYDCSSEFASLFSFSRYSFRFGWIGRPPICHTPAWCIALNLGVEFFLLFTDQIQALLSFLFPFRSFFPISKQYHGWCLVSVLRGNKNLSCHGCCIMPKHISCLMSCLITCVAQSHFVNRITIGGCACRGFFPRDATQPDPARPSRPALARAPPAPCPSPMRAPSLSLI
jgi:hypothetical protein